MRDRQETFIEKLHECNQHKKRLLSAKNRLKKLMPLDISVIVQKNGWVKCQEDQE